MKYIGIKLVDAYPEEKDGVPGYKVVYKDGYTSWCPKATFEEYNVCVQNVHAEAKLYKLLRTVLNG